jgi:hypothetical protein
MSDPLPTPNPGQPPTQTRPPGTASTPSSPAQTPARPQPAILLVPDPAQTVSSGDAYFTRENKKQPDNNRVTMD